MFRLCLALGYPHPDYLLRMLTSRQITEWLAYYDLEPWGETRADLRAGIVASTLANCHRDPKQRPEAYRAVDFMPYRERPEQKMTAEERSAGIKQLLTKG